MVNVEGDYYILDIYCQQLWNVVQLGGVCVPFGHKAGACTIVHVLTHIFVLDMFCQQLGDICHLECVRAQVWGMSILKG